MCILSFSYGRVRVAVDGKRDTSADGRKSPYKGAFCCSFPAQRAVCSEHHLDTGSRSGRGLGERAVGKCNAFNVLSCGSAA